jgi:hypothetical protein
MSLSDKSQFSAELANKGNQISEQALQDLITSSQNVADEIMNSFNTSSSTAMSGILGGNIGKMVGNCVKEHYEALIVALRGYLDTRASSQKTQEQTIDNVQEEMLAATKTNDTYRV